jgi:hypothetical protein
VGLPQSLRGLFPQLRVLHHPRHQRPLSIAERRLRRRRGLIDGQTRDQGSS